MFDLRGKLPTSLYSLACYWWYRLTGRPCTRLGAQCQVLGNLLAHSPDRGNVLHGHWCSFRLGSFRVETQR